MSQIKMSKQSRILSYILIFGLVFLSGWEIRSAVNIEGDGVNSGENSASILSNWSSTGNKDLNLTTMWQVRELLKQKYYAQENISDEKMAYGAARGVVDSLKDPYTAFMDPSETIEFTQSLNDELEGIGAELTARDGMLTVVNTLNESPAQKAGLRPDDIIYKIDGEIAAELTLIEAIKMIRGEKGTSVVLTVIRKNTNEPFDLTIVRDKIIVESVEKKDLGSGIWLVTINEFSDDTRMEFEKALNEIKVAKADGLILDLRFNGGGYLEGSVDVMSALIRGQETVTTIKYRDEGLNEVLKTSGNSILPDTPLVVLINEGSASAAEIVAGAIRDLKRGVLMGETTYGKGSVQEVDPLADGSSVRFTIAKWFTPNGENVNETGLKPDIEVKADLEAIKDGKDNQLDEAVKYLESKL